MSTLSKLCWKQDGGNIIDFLNEPKIIDLMIQAAGASRPSAEYIQKKLRERFGEQINRDGSQEMHTIRQEIGRNIGKIMGSKGYRWLERVEVREKNGVRIFTKASTFELR